MGWVIVPLLLMLSHLSGCSSKEGKAKTHAERGLEAIRVGQYDVALNEYREALRLDPANAAFHYTMGFLYASRQQFDRAAIGYRKTL